MSTHADQVARLPPALRRFTIEADGCWLWRGRLNRNGYGRVAINGREPVAHRAVWEQVVGPVPAGLVLDHRCGVRCCVNPAHLAAVTVAENTHRGSAVLFAAYVERSPG